MEYDFKLTEYQLKFLRSKKIVKGNLLNNNRDIYDIINYYSNLYSLEFNEVIYLSINGITKEVKCCKCGVNRPKFISVKSGYKKFCSTKCSNNSEEVKKKKELVCLEKWGVDNPSKSKEVRDKLSIISKNQSEETKEKRKKTCLEKWGYVTNLNIPEVKEIVKNSLNSEEVKEKRKKTCLEKYGVESILSSKEIKDKIKETNLSKYGFEFPLQSNKIREKLKITNISRYGVDNPSKSETIKNKRIETFLNNWGVTHPMSSDIIKEKTKNSNLKKWGFTSPMKSDFIKDKIKNIKLKNWGAENNNLNEDFRKTNYNISKDHRYIRYLGNGISEFHCDNGHYFELSSDIYSHRNKNYLCHICNPRNKSFKELELFEYIRSVYNGEIIQSYRDSMEIDIYLPELKLGFEFNGLYWHSELFKDKNYHLDKTEYFQERGIRIIHIWEDDWIYKGEIIKSQIRNWLGLTENRIFARDCNISEIYSIDEYRDFLERNHIQGYISSSLRLGLYHNGELVSLMTFDHFEGRKKMEPGGWNLSRFCNKLNYNVIGGASKLLKYFIKNFNPKRIISFADKSWSNGELYSKLGFAISSISYPNYSYLIDNKRSNKQKWKKSNLVKMGFDENLSESKIMEDNFGAYKVFDCGQIKFELLI